MMAPRRILIPLVAATLTLTGLPTPASAGPQSDIPGVPLPGPVATGRLGGPVYDVVYSVEIPAGHVLIASLTGTPDTDFDLYLFAPGSTTVLYNQGVVARSTGATSSEALSYPSRFSGTYYLDLNGVSEAEGEYRLTVQVVADPTPPTARVLLNEGALVTNSAMVRVIALGFDDLSGVPEVALSADGLNWGAWQPAPHSTTWTFPPGDGIKRLWAKSRNGVGRESSASSSAISLDSTPPRVTSLVPASGSSVPSLRPTFRATFDEPIDPASWTADGLIVQGPGGWLVPGTYGVASDRRSASFTPSVELQPGLLYFAALAGVTDAAGNPVSSGEAWWVRPMIATSLSLAAAPLTVTFGTAVTLSGNAGIPEGDQAGLEHRAPDETAWRAIPTGSLPAGPFIRSFVPETSGVVRASYPGSATAMEVSSAEVPTTVRRWIAIRGSGPSVTRSGRAGQPVVLSALVRPERPGVTVSFRLHRWDSSRSLWVFVGSRGTRTGVDGEAAITWTPSAGRWAWRAVAYGTPDLAANQTSLYRWSIGR